jgi:hypothetical protein
MLSDHDTLSGTRMRSKPTCLAARGTRSTVRGQGIWAGRRNPSGGLAGILARGSGGFAVLGLVALSLVGGACASYPARTQSALAEYQSGNLSAALASYENPATTGAPFLAGAEAGTVALTAGEWDHAITNFTKSAQVVEAIERSALISPQSLGESLLSWAVNDTFKTYEGEGYERVMLHDSLGIAYLAKGDFSATQVEVRRSNALLESEEKLYEKEYKAGGMGHFLSAVAYELDGKPDEAYIDYKRMEAKGVGTDLAGRALVRLATQLGFEQDLQEWKQRYGAESDVPRDAANVVLIAGVGLGPYKIEHSIVIPLPDGFLSWAVPDFKARPQPVHFLELSVAGGDRSIRTAVVEDVSVVAKENLDDRIAWLAAKSAVRAVLKRELTQELSRQIGGWGELIGDVFSVVSERADLRAWQTLPDSWQAARVFLPPGRQELVLRAEGGPPVSLGTFELDRGETMFIFARSVGTHLYAHPIGGRRVDESTPALVPTN